MALETEPHYVEFSTQLSYFETHVPLKLLQSESVNVVPAAGEPLSEQSLVSHELLLVLANYPKQSTVPLEPFRVKQVAYVPKNDEQEDVFGIQLVFPSHTQLVKNVLQPSSPENV